MKFENYLDLYNTQEMKIIIVLLLNMQFKVSCLGWKIFHWVIMIYLHQCFLFQNVSGVGNKTKSNSFGIGRHLTKVKKSILIIEKFRKSYHEGMMIIWSIKWNKKKCSAWNCWNIFQMIQKTSSYNIIQNKILILNNFVES